MGDALEGWVDPLELRKRKHELAKMLIQVKGRKHMLVRQQSIGASSLNQGDCFILDCDSKIYQWNGRTANRIEKAKAMDICLRIKEKERIGNAAIVVIDDCADHDGHCSCEKDRLNEEKFWELIGGSSNDVKTAEEGGEDDEERARAALFRVPPSGNGEPVCEEVQFSKLEKQLLSTDSSFILDCGDEVWVWIGRKSNKHMRKQAETKGKDLLATVSRPAHAALHVMWEGTELVLFMEKFSNWGKLPIAVQATPVVQRPKAAAKEFDVSRMLYTAEELKKMDAANKPEVVRSGLAKRLGPVDDGKQGRVRVWKALHDGGYEVRPEFYGHLWDADSYVVLYTHQHRSHEEHLLYFWQGAKSPITVKGAASVQTIFMNQGLEGISEHIRVAQFKEPEHFINVFSFLKMHAGPSPSFILLDPEAFEAQMGKKKLVRSRTYMLLNMQALAAVRLPFTIFQVRGRRACQVTTASLDHTLNSNDCMIVCFVEKGAVADASPQSKIIERIIVWVGDRSSDETQHTAEACAAALYPLYQPFAGELETLPEGEEKSMLAALSEHNNLPDGLSVVTVNQASAARLFLCSTSSGAFEAEEIATPTHADLLDRHMFIVDASPNCIYIWEGKQAGAGVQQEAQRVASEYSHLVKEHKKLSSPVPVEYVKQGAEPALFKSYFFGWPTTEKLKAKPQQGRRQRMDRSATLGQAFRSTREFKRPPLMR